MKPILFNTEMVRAILAGRKTQTRRIVKPQPPEGADVTFVPANYEGDLCGLIWQTDRTKGYQAAPYQPGDILYVRETWTRASTWFGVDPSVGINDGYLYRADWDVEDHPIWNPSIHMPKEAARLFLRVMDVRAEQLWDISSEDVYAEGTDNRLWAATRDAFRRLWDSTIKPSDIDRYGWAANPWVWVISFERYDPADKGGADG